MDPSLRLSGCATVQVNDLVRDSNNKGINIGSGLTGSITFTGSNYTTDKTNKFLKINDTLGTIVAEDILQTPGASTDEAIVRYDGTTGKIIQNSLVTINELGHILPIN